MALVKVCSRGHKNPSSAIMCQECLEDLSRLSPVELGEDDDGELLEILDVEVALDDIDLEEATLIPKTPPTTQNDDDCLIVFPVDRLTFHTDDGLVFSAGSGDIVGRAKTGSEILQNYPTVSRLHFRLGQRDMSWFISNLSDNGTWINGQELALGEERPLAPGDELKLSSQCRLTVAP
ncbi:MAG: FHA domain-containing protein [Deltaproteobacteria bacterium]|jgi:hypothetical protein|nr:FHA domain-containing protein [Deltaproteobacteria bacterium]